MATSACSGSLCRAVNHNISFLSSRIIQESVTSWKIYVHPPPCCIITTNSVHSTMVPIQARTMDPISNQGLVSLMSQFWARRRRLRPWACKEVNNWLTIIPPELLVYCVSGIQSSPGEHRRQREVEHTDSHDSGAADGSMGSCLVGNRIGTSGAHVSFIALQTSGRAAWFCEDKCTT